MKPIFTGAATAIITPFDNNNKVDYSSFEKLINWQIESGIDGIVVAGTTGESATLSPEEHKQVIQFCIDTANKRVPIIAGTGSNNTQHAIESTKFANQAGADAVLVVTPYYNKATQTGLVEHYKAIADVSDVPVIAYNVPSRTGCNIEPQTLKAMTTHGKITAIKEASGDLSQAIKMQNLCNNKITMYSGNDDQIVPLLSIGAKGVISVLSNVLPKQTSEMVHLYLEGKTAEALDLQLKYLDLINLLFCEVNPIPVKAAMEMLGVCSGNLRLPLTKMQEENAKKLEKELIKLNII